MIDQLYTDQVDNTFKRSIKDRSLAIPKHYVTTKHAIRHTMVIHLMDYMKNRGLENNPDFLIASYIADESYYINSNYSLRIQEYVQWIITLRKSHYKKTIKLFEQLTIDDLVASLVYLWIDLLFLDYHSNRKETRQFIKDKLFYTKKVLNKVHQRIKGSSVDKSYITIMDVLWNELNIAQSRLDQSKGEDIDEY